jgi:hypothetical protein
MSFARVVATALASAWALLTFGANVARAADDDCTFATRKAIIADLTHEGTGGLAKTVGTGLLLIAARGGPAPLRIGSAILFGVEALGLATTTAQAAQMPLQGDPDQKMRICHAEGSFASTLGFRTMAIVSADPGLPDRFQAKIQQEFDAPFVTPAAPNPLWDSQSGQKANAIWDDQAIEDILKKLSSAPKPTFDAPTNSASLAELPHPAPRPVPPFDFAAPPPAIPITGEVVDDATDDAVDQGFVDISTASVTAGWWQTVMIDSDGTFSLDLPPGTYVASVSVPGYVPVRRSFTLTAGEPARDLELRLPQQSPYPCSFTVVNNTGWAIELFMGTTQGPIEMVPPWSHAEFAVNRAFNIGPQAEFRTGPALVWPPVAANCDGPGIAYLNP